ncbi:MAG TPA: serine hydrolase domain-containing protein [Thermomicrobiales bacterium]|nr:serine hydrolase domain-containing protein [Thermomicrobiales bacterium]
MAKKQSPASADPGASFRVPGWPRDRPDYTSLAAAVQGEASRWNVPGIAVGILNDGAIETTSTGFANLATRIPMTDDTISQIGSISKVFTATLAMILVEDGTLDLDTPVVAYLPDLVLADETVRDTVTLRHLLSHTSGIEGDRFIDYGRGDDALARAVAEFDTLRQWFVPGDLWSYSNAGFYLACRVIEAISAKPFETVFRERLVEPLGLETCFFFAEEIITRAHAVGHYLKNREDGPSVVPYYSLPRHVAGTGLVVTSTRELLRFAQLHMGNGKVDRTRLLSTKSARLMQEPIVEAGDFHRSYGLGWCIHDFPEFRTISHGGATNGFRANLTALPDKGFAIAILTNGEPGSRAIQEIEAWALEHYLEVSRPVPEPVSLSAKKIAAFAGDYHRHDGQFTLTVADHGLDFRMLSLDEETGAVEADRTFPLVAVGERRFWVPDGVMKGAIVDFITYEGNGTTQEYLRTGGRLAERVAAPEPPKSKKASKAKGKKG